MSTLTEWRGSVIDVSDQRWPTFFGSDSWSGLLQWIAQQMGLPRWQNGLAVYRVEYDLIDCPMVRVSRFVRDETGTLMRNPNDQGEPLRVMTEHMVVSSLPAWWTP